MSSAPVRGFFPYQYSHSYVSVSYDHVLADIFNNWRPNFVADYMRHHDARSVRIDGVPVGPPPVPNPNGSITFIDLVTQTEMPPAVATPAIYFSNYNEIIEFHSRDPHWTGINCFVSIDFLATTVNGSPGLWVRDDNLSTEIGGRVVEAMKVARKAYEMEHMNDVPASGSGPIDPSEGNPVIDGPPTE